MIDRERAKALRAEGLTCEICGRDGLRLCCDHDHDTGLTRGWICVACNRGLGYLQDSPRLLATALAYLAKSGKAWQ